MAGIEELLERLITDQGFRAALQRDPQAALAGYDLSDDDRKLLDAQLDTSAGQSGAVEQRTSKSALGAVMGGLADLVADAPEQPGERWSGEYTLTSARHRLGDDDSADLVAAEPGDAPPETPDDRAQTMTAIALAESGGQQQQAGYHQVTLENAFVTSVPTSGDEEGVGDLAAGTGAPPPEAAGSAPSSAHVAISLGDGRTIESDGAAPTAAQNGWYVSKPVITIGGNDPRGDAPDAGAALAGDTHDASSDVLTEPVTLTHEAIERGAPADDALVAHTGPDGGADATPLVQQQEGDLEFMSRRATGTDAGGDAAHELTHVAQQDMGAAFVPETDDELLVGFESAEPDQPYIVGGLFNPDDAADGAIPEGPEEGFVERDGVEGAATD